MAFSFSITRFAFEKDLDFDFQPQFENLESYHPSIPIASITIYWTLFHPSVHKATYLSSKPDFASSSFSVTVRNFTSSPFIQDKHSGRHWSSSASGSNRLRDFAESANGQLLTADQTRQADSVHSLLNYDLAYIDRESIIVLDRSRFHSRQYGTLSIVKDMNLELSEFEYSSVFMDACSYYYIVDIFSAHDSYCNVFNVQPDSFVTSPSVCPLPTQRIYVPIFDHAGRRLRLDRIHCLGSCIILTGVFYSFTTSASESGTSTRTFTPCMLVLSTLWRRAEESILVKPPLDLPAGIAEFQSIWIGGFEIVQFTNKYAGYEISSLMPVNSQNIIVGLEKPNPASNNEILTTTLYHLVLDPRVTNSKWFRMPVVEDSDMNWKTKYFSISSFMRATSSVWTNAIALAGISDPITEFKSIFASIAWFGSSATSSDTDLIRGFLLRLLRILDHVPLSQACGFSNGTPTTKRLELYPWLEDSDEKTLYTSLVDLSHFNSITAIHSNDKDLILRVFDAVVDGILKLYPALSQYGNAAKQAYYGNVLR